MILQHRNRVWRTDGKDIIRDVRGAIRQVPEDVNPFDSDCPDAHHRAPGGNAPACVTPVMSESGSSGLRSTADPIGNRVFEEIRRGHTGAVGQPLAEMLRDEAEPPSDGAPR